MLRKISSHFSRSFFSLTQQPQMHYTIATAITHEAEEEHRKEKKCASRAAAAALVW